jgi:hypothetical protein
VAAHCGTGHLFSIRQTTDAYAGLALDLSEDEGVEGGNPGPLGFLPEATGYPQEGGTQGLGKGLGILGRHVKFQTS